MISIEALQLYCKKYKISVRKLAKETGVSKTMAARFLTTGTVDMKQFASILIWAMLPDSSQTLKQAEMYLKTAPPKIPDTPARRHQ